MEIHNARASDSSGAMEERSWKVPKASTYILLVSRDSAKGENRKQGGTSGSSGAMEERSWKVQKASTYLLLTSQDSAKGENQKQAGTSDSSGAMEERSRKVPKASTYISSRVPGDLTAVERNISTIDPYAAAL